MSVLEKPTALQKVKAHIKLLRIHHYLKNLLVFAPLIFGGEMFQVHKILECLLVFLSFSAVSSTVYIINDICDREKDRNHPTKCKRPIASGAVSIKAAIIMAAVLLVLALACTCLNFNLGVTLILAAYLLLNLGYSFGLKNIPIIDIVILVSGFFFRVLCGALISGIQISNWLYLTVIVLALFLSLGKRRNELIKYGDSSRKVLKSYSPQFLDKSMNMCLTMTNVFYALWSMDVGSSASGHEKYLITTVPLVLLITMRYSMIVEQDSDGDPVEVLLHDKVLIGMCLLYAAVMFFLLYF